jgi:hypothetical protein
VAGDGGADSRDGIMRIFRRNDTVFEVVETSREHYGPCDHHDRQHLLFGILLGWGLS